MTIEEWRTNVLDHIERLAGPTAKQQITEKWSEHAARERVEVTVLGPYSSGKSSLIRRLVVDAGVSVPPWLTVSARPETFELNEVAAGEVSFTDAPGFGGGREQHDELAQEALALSDAFLLVVPPSLLTTDRSFASAVLSGEFFFDAPGGDLASVTVAVIGQADVLGIDPADDPVGMRELADRKRAELVDQLRSEVDSPLDDLTVHCVAADPYEAQARTALPVASDFDPYRAWDGIDQLSATLAQLAERREELRGRAEVRFLCLAARGIAAHQAALLDEQRSSAEDLQRRAAELSSIRKRVDALVESAKVDLQDALERLFTELGVEIADASDAARDRVNARMQDVIERWVRRSNPRLEEIISDANAAIDTRLASAVAQRTDDFLRSLQVARPAEPSRPDQHARVIKIIEDANGQMQYFARTAFEHDLHRTLDDFLRPRFPNLPPLGQITKQDLDKTLGAATAVVGILSEGVRFHQDHVEAKRELEAREAARTKLRAAAGDLADQVVEGSGDEPGWRASADAVLDALRDQLKLPLEDAAIRRRLASIVDQQALVVELRDLVTEGATLASASARSPFATPHHASKPPQ